MPEYSQPLLVTFLLPPLLLLLNPTSTTKLPAYYKNHLANQNRLDWILPSKILFIDKIHSAKREWNVTFLAWNCRRINFYAHECCCCAAHLYCSFIILPSLSEKTCLLPCMLFWTFLTNVFSTNVSGSWSYINWTTLTLSNILVYYVYCSSVKMLIQKK